MPAASADLVPSQPGLIIAITNFFTEDECESLSALADAQVEPPPKADLAPKRNEAFLDRDTALIDSTYPCAQNMGSTRTSPAEVDGRLPIGLHGDGRRAMAGQVKLIATGEVNSLAARSILKGQGPGEETEFTFLFTSTVTASAGGVLREASSHCSAATPCS